jgi:hypothetical protein
MFISTYEFPEIVPVELYVSSSTPCQISRYPVLII